MSSGNPHSITPDSRAPDSKTGNGTIDPSSNSSKP